VSFLFIFYYAVVVYFYNTLGDLKQGVAFPFFDKILHKEFYVNLFPLVIGFWLFVFFSYKLFNRGFGIDSPNHTDTGFLGDLFNLIVFIGSGLISIVTFLISIPVAYGMIYVIMPVVCLFLLSTIPLLVYGLVVTAHYFFIRHPAEKYLDQDRPDITGFKQATRSRSQKKSFAFVSENYRRRAQKFTDDIDRATQQEQQIREQHQADVEKQKIQMEISRLKRQEQELTKKYGTKAQRQSKQAMNEQEAKLMQRYTEKTKRGRL